MPHVMSGLSRHSQRDGVGVHSAEQHTGGADSPLRGQGRRRSLRLKLFLVVTVPVFALLVALVAIIATRGLNARAVSDSVEALETREKLNEGLLLVFDAESATRGYLATGRSDFLLVHDRAVSRLPGVLEELGALIDDEGLSRRDSRSWWIDRAGVGGPRAARIRAESVRRHGDAAVDEQQGQAGRAEDSGPSDGPA